MGEIEETVSDAVERVEHPPESRLNSVVAVLVAVIATLMALCNIKDGNIVQNMTQAQAKGVDAWSFYQAKSTKQHLAENMVAVLSIQRDAGVNLSPTGRAVLARRIEAYTVQIAKYDQEKETIRKQAEGYEREYDRLNLHDDQFDMADAGFTVSIALLGISALTKKGWLVGVAIAFATFGVALGLAGFLSWNLHPDALARFLS